MLLSLYLKGKRPIRAYSDTDRDTGWVIDPSQNGRFQALAHKAGRRFARRVRLRAPQAARPRSDVP